MMKKLNANKSLALILAVALLVVSVAGTTMAWLMDSTQEVTNTFTYGDINIELDETKRDPDGNPVDEDKDGVPDRTPDGNEYEMMPGQDIEKDPVVTVLKDSENSWVFVKLEKKGGATVDGVEYTFDDYLTYTIADGWTQLVDDQGKAVEGVYFRYQGETDADTEIPVLKDNKVTVKGEVTKEMLNALNTDPTNATYPQLVITAYAAQYVGFEAEVSEGADAPTAAQENAAALKVWNTVVVPGTTEAPVEETTAP